MPTQKPAKYNVILHTKSGKAIHLNRLNADEYSDIRDWLAGKNTERTFDNVFMLPHVDLNGIPHTYYFPPAVWFIEYFDINPSHGV